MENEFFEFVHVRHFDSFVQAARAFRCHILVRKTGRASLNYVGKPGYAGKRADMKAKTAQRDMGRYKLAGLVCSPLVHPGACKPNALAEWGKSAHLITVPTAGFSDREQPRGCATPYMLQTNRDHPHYGCVALVEHGLLTPHYVHGDYDLYAILPAGQPFDPSTLSVRTQSLGATMGLPNSMTLAQRVRHQATLDAHPVMDQVGPLTLQVTTFLGVAIANIGPGVLAGLMLNHGEQVNLGSSQQDFQEVLAFMPEPQHGAWAKILHNQQEHLAFYRSV